MHPLKQVYDEYSIFFYDDTWFSQLGCNSTTAAVAAGLVCSHTWGEFNIMAAAARPAANRDRLWA